MGHRSTFHQDRKPPARFDKSMEFSVRYWSSLLPAEYREKDGTPRWLNYSIHPGSKLGLHNALLAVHDRNEIMQAHGGEFECAVFVTEGERTERLSQKTANALFAALPRGEVKWLNIRKFLLPPLPEEVVTASAAPETEQLPLFPHVHTPYDDLDQTPHAIDVDI
jgi:hypothetical protein